MLLKTLIFAVILFTSSNAFTILDDSRITPWCPPPSECKNELVCLKANSTVKDDNDIYLACWEIQGTRGLCC